MVRKKRKPKFTQRVSLGLRVSPELKEKRVAAAVHPGRSQSTEAAVRLERSFDRQDLLSEALTLAFGEKLAGLLMMLGNVIGPSGDVTVHQKDRSPSPFRLEQWTDDPAAYDQAVQSAIRVLNALRPPGGVPKPAADHGVRIADQLIRAVGGGPIDTIPKLAAPKIRELLGAAADRCKNFEPGSQTEQRLQNKPSLADVRSDEVVDQSDFERSPPPPRSGIQDLANEMARRANSKYSAHSPEDRVELLLELQQALSELMLEDSQELRRRRERDGRSSTTQRKEAS
jgi:hypothetical protein